MGSFMLLAVTNHITHDVASVPFLWILPLTLYLLTFILCFEGRGWYRRHIFLGPLLVVVGAMAWALHADRSIHDIKEAVALFSAGLFVCCMFFHGELADMKPAPRYLTTLLPDGLARRRAGRRLSSASSRRGSSRPTTSSASASWSRCCSRSTSCAACRSSCRCSSSAASGFTAYHVYHYIESLSQQRAAS